MKFIVLLLVLWVEKFSDWRRRVQRDGPWLRLLAWAEGRAGWQPWLVLLSALLVPLVLLGGLLWLLQPLAYGWLLLPVHLLVLLYSLGRGDVKVALGAFRDAWRREELETAALAAERDMQVRVEEPDALLPAVQERLAWQAHEGFFAVIFWYALLGPLAALGYRLLALAEAHGRGQALRELAGQFRHALDWLPARALVASMGLVGNFVSVNRVLLPELLHWHQSAERLVGAALRAAGDCQGAPRGEAGATCLDDLWQLLVRAALLWYAVFALWTLLA
ncbi:MAG TPA: regulatory signaling modulator protein AmpE [Pseudomonas sp.]|jgi:AmpE protein|nr:regulatory signaling modulator protein AmpE [Pseudomonas sp.]